VDLFSILEGGGKTEDTLFNLVFEGEIKTGLDVQDVKSGLAKILRLRNPV
jgi:hypothetical protein